MNDIFCWPVWVPLSRLSFAAYLIHMVVLGYSERQAEGTWYFKEITVVSYYKFFRLKFDDLKSDECMSF